MLRALLTAATSSFILFSAACYSPPATCTAEQTSCGGACVDILASHDNCGACGTVCGQGQACVAGTCSTSCPVGQAICGQVCATLTTDNVNCGSCGTVCPAGQVCSNGACATNCAQGLHACTRGTVTTCVDTLNDDSNCGACGTTCAAGERCVQSHCIASCGAPLSTCPTDGGSEFCANTHTDNDNCGACGTSCAPGQVCSNGTCAQSCALNLATCSADGGDAYCANTTNDPSNCGTCGTTCSSGQQCVLGQCRASCGNGLTVCSDADAGTDYCANFLSDNANCGACGTTCSPGQTCQSGQCIGTCAPGTDSCSVDGGTSFCANLQTDTVNCGSCGTQCPSGQVCSNGSCATSCASSLGTCSTDAGTNFCANLQTDNTHCGSCDIACAPGQACQGGSCNTTCAAGSSLCTTDGGQSYCANFLTDNVNCGACGTVCQPGQVCSNGECSVTCSLGLATCGLDAGAPYCANGTIDPFNCGACGTTCGQGEACIAGNCHASCGAGLSFCNLDGGTGYCANRVSDSLNCGACGVKCTSGQVCRNSACTSGCDAPNSVCQPNDGGATYCSNTLTDPNNCGSCFIACPVAPNNAASVCRSGTCSYVCVNGFVDADGVAANGCESSPTIPLSGLNLWLRADQGVTIDLNSKVTRWADQSPQGNHVTNQSLPLAPTLVPNVLNGLPVVRFSKSRLVGATPGAFNFGTGDFTWVYVARTYGTFTSDRNRVFGTLREGSPYDGFTAGFRTAGTSANRPYGMFRSSGGTEVFSMAAAGSLNTWVTAMGRRASGVASLYKDWVIEDTQSASFSVSGDGYLAIGAERLNGPEFHNGDIAEILIYNRALTSAEVDKVRAYLTAKYQQLPKNCFDLKNKNPSAPSGVYSVDPVGGAPFRVYCDMTTDNGGWTKILHIKDTPYVPTAGGFGDVATSAITTASKLSDAQINALRGSGLAFYRIVGTGAQGQVFTPVPLYLMSNKNYIDTATGMGLVNTSVGACSAATLSACSSFTTVNNATSLDTNSWMLTPNDCSRIFTDYNNVPGCYPNDGIRCFNAGASCGPHARLDNVTVLMRPLPKSCQEIKQHTGTTANGLYFIDNNGVSTQVYCDMTTAGGGWTQVYDQDVNVMPGYQSKANWLAGVNVNAPNSGQYSILSRLDRLKSGNNFEFMIDWPNAPVGSVRWVQYENPTIYKRNAAVQAQPSVMSIVMSPANQANDQGGTFNGLSLYDGTDATIAGDAASESGLFWWAIGEVNPWFTGIPSFYTSSSGGAFSGTTRTRLWVR